MPAPADVDERRDTWQDYVKPCNDIPFYVSYSLESLSGFSYNNYRQVDEII